MKLGITHKLFLVVLATAIFAVVLVGSTTHVSFTRGFLGYLNELAVERMELVTARVQRAYVEHGNWDFMRDTPAAWFGMLRPGDDEERVTNALPGSDIPISDLTGAFLRMGLVDAQGQWVAGYRNIATDSQSQEKDRDKELPSHSPRHPSIDVTYSTLRQPVKANGQIVGWVVLATFQSVTDAGKQRFHEDQLHAILITSLIAVGLAGLIAFWLARTLVAPVKRIAAATHRLASGQYSTRVEVSSHDEVGNLAADFNHLAQTLQRNEHMRREFMADVSHELRTPLGILRGELEAMDDGIRPMTPAALHSLQAEVVTLSQLVDDFYELSLSDAGALVYRMSEIDLRDPLMQAVHSMQTRIAQQNLRLDLQLPEHPLLVSADTARLQQLFHNLLENSLRYTDAGGQIAISARIVADKVEINWQDSAPGVSEDVLPRLFERFFRGEGSRNRATGGSGLGLAICRNIVEAHGGTIAAKASPLGGLWIITTLPTP